MFLSETVEHEHGNRFQQRFSETVGKSECYITGVLYEAASLMISQLSSNMEFNLPPTGNVSITTNI